MNWTQAEEALLLHCVQSGMSTAEIHRLFTENGLDKHYEAIKSKIARERKKNPVIWRKKVKPSTSRTFSNPIRLETDKILLLFDIHAPFHDARWIDKVIDLAIARGVSDVGIGGDLVDFSAFSKWGRQDRVEAEDEIESATQIVSVLAENFDRVVYSGGNHENRLPRKTDNLLSLQSAMELFVKSDNVQITDYHWFEVKSGGRDWYIEHPKNASIHATVVAKKLAIKYGVNVVSGHGHLWGITVDDSGKFFAVDAGTCCDHLKLAYDAKVHNTRPKMQRGACIIEHGLPILLHPENISLWLD